MIHFSVKLISNRKISSTNKVVDHALKPHRTAVVWRINTLDSVCMEFLDFRWQDYTATATENFNVPGAFFLEQVVHVFEILVVTALVRRHCDGVYIFLDSGVHDFLDAAVMAEVNHLNASRLDDAAHDIDSSIVPVEERGSGYNSDFILGNVGRLLLHDHLWFCGR